MEQSSKNQDCYFYYYSTCTKGDSCHFRHEPSALGCEVMCTYWQQGNCMNEHCNFRHMELKKNRKSIPCYWESQRGGCKKPHCPFLHTLDRPAPAESTINPSKTTGPKPVTQEWSNRPDGGKFPETSGEGSVGHGSNESSSFISGSVVDPIIVNFNEETDNEGNTPSPQKPPRPSSPRPPLKTRKQKTYEEERIDEISANAAAYYSYPVYQDNFFQPIAEEFKEEEEKSSLDFEILTLEEIKRRKRAQEDEITQFNLMSESLPIEGNADADKLPTGRKRKSERKIEEVKPIKLRRSGSNLKSLAEDKAEIEADAEVGKEEAEMRLCDSTSDGKEENGKQEDELESFLDDADDTEAVGNIIDDIDQLLGDT